MNFIKSSIDEKLLDKINIIFDKIILLFIDKIKNLDDKIDDDQDQEEIDDNENEIFKMFDTLEIFVDKLYKNNLSLLFLFTLKFTENFLMKQIINVLVMMKIKI